MYIFTDPKVVECLHRVVNAFGKIGEHINLVASADALRLSVVNSSLTVLGTATFSLPLFSGPGASKNVHIKARATDLVFKRLENEEVSSLRLRFVVTRSGQEQFEIQLDYGNGIKKVFVVACLQTAMLPVDFEPIGQRPCTLECLPSVLKDAFASCESGADELKVSFQHNLVNLLARKRGMRVKSDSSILNSGLRTIINLQPETFRQVTVRIPRQLEFKLKEFRVMLSFFDQLGEDIPIVAKFNDAVTTTPLVFRSGVAAFPGIEFLFKFMAKINIPRTASEQQQSLLKVGPQPDWVLGSASASDSSYSRHSDPMLRQIRRERDRRLRRIAAVARPGSSEASTSTETSFSEANLSETNFSETNVAETSSTGANSAGVSEEDSNDFDPAATEVGLTQGVASVRGLFD